MPPSMPPALFVRVTISPPSSAISSLCSEPRMRAAPKPEPNSTPLTAGITKIAAESLLSSPPNTGEPAPAGTPVTMHSTTPPTESPSAFAASIASRILSPAASSSTGNGADLTRSRVSFVSPSALKRRSFIPAIESMCAPVSIPRRARSCAHIPPAMQSGAVRRPEKWPPPRPSWKPRYLISAVRSAWPGRGRSRSLS